MGMDHPLEMIGNSLIMSQFIDESVEEGDLWNPIAPPMTSLKWQRWFLCRYWRHARNWEYEWNTNRVIIFHHTLWTECECWELYTYRTCKWDTKYPNQNPHYAHTITESKGFTPGDYYFTSHSISSLEVITDRKWRVVFYLVLVRITQLRGRIKLKILGGDNN